MQRPDCSRTEITDYSAEDFHLLVFPSAPLLMVGQLGSPGSAGLSVARCTGLKTRADFRQT